MKASGNATTAGAKKAFKIEEVITLAEEILEDCRRRVPDPITPHHLLAYHVSLRADLKERQELTCLRRTDHASSSSSPGHGKSKRV